MFFCVDISCPVSCRSSWLLCWYTCFAVYNIPIYFKIIYSYLCLLYFISPPTLSLSLLLILVPQYYEGSTLFKNSCVPTPNFSLASFSQLYQFLCGLIFSYFLSTNIFWKLLGLVGIKNPCLVLFNFLIIYDSIEYITRVEKNQILH